MALAGQEEILASRLSWTANSVGILYTPIFTQRFRINSLSCDQEVILFFNTCGMVIAFLLQLKQLIITNHKVAYRRPFAYLTGEQTMKKLLLAILVLFTTSANAIPFTLAGDTVDASIIKTIDNGYGLGRNYGFGLDEPFVVQDGLADQKQYSSAFRLNVDGDQFSIKFITSAGWQSGTVFRLDDLDFSVGASALTAINVDTNISGYTLNVGSDFLELGLGGTHFNNSTYFTGRFVVASVPEPTSMALVALGLFVLFTANKNRKA